MGGGNEKLDIKKQVFSSSIFFPQKIIIFSKNHLFSPIQRIKTLKKCFKGRVMIFQENKHP